MVKRKKMTRFAHLLAVVIDGPGAVGDVLNEMAVRLLAPYRGEGPPPLAEPVTVRDWTHLVVLVRDEISAFATAMETAPEAEKLAPGTKVVLWGTLTRIAAACLADAIDLDLVDDADEDIEAAAAHIAAGPDYYKLKYEEERGKAEQREGEAGALRRANNEIESENARLRRGSQEEGRVEKLYEEMRDERDKLLRESGRLRRLLATTVGQRDAVKTELAEVVAAADDACKQRDDLFDELRKTQDAHDATRAELVAVRGTLADVEAVRERLYLEREKLKSKIYQLEQDVKGAKFVAEGERDGHARHQSIMKSLEARVADAGEKLEVARGLLDIARTEKKQLQAELSKRMADLRNARDRRNELWKVVQELGELMRAGIGLTRESQPKARPQ